MVGTPTYMPDFNGRFNGVLGGGGQQQGVLGGGGGSFWQRLLDPQTALPVAAALIGGRGPQESLAGGMAALGPGLAATDKRLAVNDWLKAGAPKDVQHPATQKLMAAAPDLAEKVIGAQFVAGRAPAAPTTREFFDPKTNTNHVKQFNPATGGWDDIGFGKPAQGTSLEVGADGSVRMIQGVGVNAEGNQPLTKPETSKIQGDIPALEQQKQQVDHIADLYDPNFLTYTGRARTAVNRIIDKTGYSGPEGKAQLAGATKFKQNVEQVFNAYRKDITGAAASVQELERLKESVINTDQSPTEFEAAMGEFAGQLKRGLDIKKQLLAEGIPLGSTQFSKRFDQLFLGGGEATPAAQTGGAAIGVGGGASQAAAGVKPVPPSGKLAPGEYYYNPSGAQ